MCLYLDLLVLLCDYNPQKHVDSDMSLFSPFPHPQFCLFSFLPQMSWNGSEQLEKAMEEVLDDDDEVKLEKSSVEKMEKHSDPESRPLEPRPSGIDSRLLGTFTVIVSTCRQLQSASQLFFTSPNHAVKLKYTLYCTLCRNVTFSQQNLQNS